MTDQFPAHHPRPGRRILERWRATDDGTTNIQDKDDLARLLSCIGLFLVIAATTARAETPAYVGSAVCADCHADVTADWARSDHAKAWTLPDETTVLGDFDNAEFEHGGQLTRFLRDGDRFLIETEGPDGVRRAYEVVGVAGIDPLQQYLLSPEPGRVQTYDIAWDVEGARWYPVFPDQVAFPGDGFHWTGPYKNWDGRCAECHATGYSRNYSPVTNSFKPQMSEIGVGCEGCHGPGEAHVAWAAGPDLVSLAAGLSPVGLTADLGASQDAEVMQCLTCHSRREAMGDGNPVPGTNYHDVFTIACCARVSITPTARSLTRYLRVAPSCNRKCTEWACAVPIATTRMRPS